MQQVGEVGGAQFVDCGKQGVGALIAVDERQSANLIPRHRERMAAAPDASAWLANVQRRDRPVAHAVGLDAHVENGHLLAGLDEINAPVK